MDNMRTALLALSIAILPLLTACEQSISAAPSAPPPPPVSVATVVQKQVNEWDEFTGRLEAIDKMIAGQ